MFRDPGRQTSWGSTVTVRGECMGRPEAGAVILCYKVPECSMPHSTSYLQGVLRVGYGHFWGKEGHVVSDRWHYGSDKGTVTCEASRAHPGVSTGNGQH